MKKIFLIMVPLVFSSCTSPTPVAMSDDSISLKYDALVNSKEDVGAEAEKYCATMNKKAKFRATTDEGSGLGFHYDHYDCVKK